MPTRTPVEIVQAYLPSDHPLKGDAEAIQQKIDEYSDYRYAAADLLEEYAGSKATNFDFSGGMRTGTHGSPFFSALLDLAQRLRRAAATNVPHTVTVDWKPDINPLTGQEYTEDETS